MAYYQHEIIDGEPRVRIIADSFKEQDAMQLALYNKVLQGLGDIGMQSIEEMHTTTSDLRRIQEGATDNVPIDILAQEDEADGAFTVVDAETGFVMETNDDGGYSIQSRKLTSSSKEEALPGKEVSITELNEHEVRLYELGMVDTVFTTLEPQSLGYASGMLHVMLAQTTPEDHIPVVTILNPDYLEDMHSAAEKKRADKQIAELYELFNAS